MKLLVYTVFLLTVFQSKAATVTRLHFPALVNKFRAEKPGFWTDDTDCSAALRNCMLRLADSCAREALDPRRMHLAELHRCNRAELPEYIDIKDLAEDYFTDALVTYCMDMCCPPEIGDWLSSDQVSSTYNAAVEQNVSEQLLTIHNREELIKIISALQPHTAVYTQLMAALHVESTSKEKSGQLQKIKLAVQWYRWLFHFRLDKMIVVNIASATLHYFERDSEALDMKAVVGKPGTKTPRFASYCNEIILYPYWHVPHSIAVNEMLPWIKKSPAVIDALNLQVLDKSGRQLDPADISWSSFNKTNFPYLLRQSTGCNNALGVIKFNLTSPYSVYLHDTNLKTAFKSSRRYFSHGCIRIEKPVELAQKLLDQPLDTALISSCVREQTPMKLMIQPVPVFVIYMPAELNENGEITYYDDVYKLIKQ